MRDSVVHFAFMFVVAAALIANGAIASTPKEWDGVRVTDDDERVEGCEYLGEVKGKSGWGGALAQNVGEEKAYKHLKRNAWEMGGNTVLLLFGRSGWGGSKFRGEVYLCEDELESGPGMTVLGGIQLCSPDQSSLDYLSVERESGQPISSGLVQYEFKVPIELGLGGFEPNLGILKSTGGYVSEAYISWEGLSEAEQQELWETLETSFVESKGEPDVYDSAKNAKEWHELDGKKVTLIDWDQVSGKVMISARCNDPAALDQMGKPQVARDGAAAAF